MSNPTSTTPILKIAERWLSEDKDPKTRAQIADLVSANNTQKLEELLRTRVEFGTAGLRARMEAGYSRLNKLTIISASQGLSAYVLEHVKDARDRGVVIGHDHRYNSIDFSRLTAAAFLDKGFKVFWYPHNTATPMVPFAVKRLGASCGVMITASHNPKDDNGYKVYWSNGAQIKPPLDEGIAHAIEENSAPKSWNLDAVVGNSNVKDITEEMEAAYFDNAKQSLVLDSEFVSGNGSQDLKYVYTAMHGVGAPFVKCILEVFGFPPYVPVPEQIDADPDFPTVSFPNPEEKGALDMAKALADSKGIHLVVANDPDADRFAAAEKQRDGTWLTFTGDQLGTIFAAAVLDMARAAGVPDTKLAMVNSTVSSRMLEVMAKKEGFRYKDTLTGFKWMANELAQMHETEGCFIGFGYEEAIGYMIRDQVFDKDGITALVVFVQLAAKLNREGKLIKDYLEEMYERYGYFVSANSYFICHDPKKTDAIFHRIRYGDSSANDGKERIQVTRSNSATGAVLTMRYPRTIGGFDVSYIRDLTVGFEMSDVDKQMKDESSVLKINESQLIPVFPVSSTTHMITFETRNGGRLTMRTSGTEPKIKYYLEVRSEDNDREAAANDLETMSRAVADELFQATRNGLV